MYIIYVCMNIYTCLICTYNNTHIHENIRNNCSDATYEKNTEEAILLFPDRLFQDSLHRSGLCMIDLHVLITGCIDITDELHIRFR